MTVVARDGSVVDVTVPLDMVWELNVTDEDAQKWVQRKLPRARRVGTSLYYHPMLGQEFDWRGPRGKLIKVNVLVDLVSGRGFVSTPWKPENFTAPERELQLKNAHSITAPEPRIGLAEARNTARSVARFLVTRKRRFGGVGTLSDESREVLFGKPNWWVTGEHQGRDLELILDGVSGKHYVFSG